MVERSREDVVRGVLRVHVGEIDKELPTLKIRASDEWLKVAGERLGAGLLHLADDESAQSATAFAMLGSDTMLDLVVAYDKTGALGGREWLADNADPSELYDALRQMGKVALPFVTDLSTFVAMAVTMFPQLVLMAGASSSPKSTSGRLPTGASTGKRSKSVSITSS